MKFWGKTTQIAIRSGLEKLHTTREQVEIKVISEGRRGFLGLGKKPAEVELLPKAVLPKKETRPQKNVEKQAKESELEDQLHKLGYYLADITQKMGIETTIEVVVSKKVVTYIFETKQEGILIGRHGKTLNALQLLAQDFLDRQSQKKLQVVLDAADYRARRKETLRLLAQKVAADALYQQEKQQLDPMPAFERKIIHAALAQNSQVTTYSCGNEPRRAVVVEPAKR
ncbi:RNA-binding cell elongation regulator Jag/EloR [Ligilactobacillus faecis]|uniref:RNA-binding cell elongation regulator Jag/EloR n=1 Tax=Ligilactobacillus faecis TaxID=762833 RepID=UPI002468A890|nr:RNA-binding cell elongation regulator Jag/EloR [Ligilactobacillus faecis]WGN90220.1 RNA-binding cell elongation regulator Jag/EloR [Ligilactobacillus faecis]